MADAASWRQDVRVCEASLAQNQYNASILQGGVVIERLESGAGRGYIIRRALQSGAGSGGSNMANAASWIKDDNDVELVPCFRKLMMFRRERPCISQVRRLSAQRSPLG